MNLFSLLFPPSCIFCNRFGFTLCPDCLAQLQFTPHLICPICLKTSPDGLKHDNCQGNIVGLIYLFRYETVMKKIIRQIKYGYYYQSLYPLIDHYLVNLENSTLSKFLATKPILIPVPIHRKRMWSRGFNQSYLIAKYLAKKWHLPISQKIIIRTKNTPFQARLTKVERQKNMKDAFVPTTSVLKLGNKPLQNQNILLIDDVFTTGSTVKECAKILSNLGANKIWVLTLAHGK